MAMYLRVITFATSYGLAIFVALLLLLAALGPVSAWGAEPKYLTVSLCGNHPLFPDGRNLCEPALRRPFPDRVLCERAVDLDADGQPDQVWVDLVARLAVPGQWVEIQCPPYIVPGVP